MKQSLIFLVCVLSVLSALAGCQSNNRRSGVEVIIEGGGKFPRFLVGGWKDEKQGWQFVFEPDGTISSAVIDSGFIKVEPGKKIATIPMKMDGKAVYKLGQWTVQYLPQSRELTVKVVVDDLHIDVGPPRAIEGSSIDWFVGPVSEDWQEWKAEWFSFPKYIALTPEPGELPVDYNENPRDVLIFRKVQKAK